MFKGFKSKTQAIRHVKEFILTSSLGVFEDVLGMRLVHRDFDINKIKMMQELVK